MAHVTQKTLALMEAPDFLVDVIVRNNGSLIEVRQDMDWDDAVACAFGWLDDGFTVEIEEAGQTHESE